MGGGSWTTSSYSSYAHSTGKSYDATTGSLSYARGTSVNDVYKSSSLNEALNPRNVMRECCDSDEHPNTIPVILALDVTGSMGRAAMEVARTLNNIMTKVNENNKDVEFCVMAIGDVECDEAPVQISQFESDVRIAEQLDKVYFEGGGGGNYYESYTAAWYFGARHTKLDCWKRGKKGIIITMGDEPLNPYLKAVGGDRAWGTHGLGLRECSGDNLQDNIDTKELYEEATKKFDIYHIAVDDPACMYKSYKDDVDRSWKKYLDEDHFKISTIDGLSALIPNIIKNANTEEGSDAGSSGTVLMENVISW